LYGFYSKFYMLSSSAKILIICYKVTCICIWQ